MTISFPGIPSNLRLPLFYADIDNSQANNATVNQRALVIGQSTPDGTATPGIPALVQGSGVSARALFGKGSTLTSMIGWYRRRDTFGETWGLPLADNGAAVAATGTVTITAPATAPGTYNLYVGGELVQIPVATTQLVADIAASLALAINSDSDMQVSAAAVAGVVTLTALNKGALGNGIDIRANYLGVSGGQSTPTGMVATITPMSGGTANPILDSALAAVGEKPYDFIAHPYTDTGSLLSVKNFMAARWSWDHMLYGGLFSAYQATVSGLNTFGTAQNDPHATFMGFYDSPTPAWNWAANYCGASAVSLRNDPGLPLQTLALDVLAPPLQSRFLPTDRNVLLYDGISTFTVDDDSTVRIEQAITSYQRDPFGDPDDSYLYVERLYLIAYAVRYLRTQVQSTYGRMKLADDGTAYRPGSSIVTPKILRASIIAWYRDLEADGIVQDSDAFAANLVVQRNSTNRCRIDGILPIVPIDQLRQLCALVQFRNSTGQ